MEQILKTFNDARFSDLVKGFDECKTKSIEYDWDAGHAYSSITNCPEYTKLMDLEGVESRDMFDAIADYCNEWLSENECPPPCRIHVLKSGLAMSGCGCHDDSDREEVENAVHELQAYASKHGVDVNCLISREV